MPLGKRRLLNGSRTNGSNIFGSYCSFSYPGGRPERIACDDGEYARKNGKAWLKSSDWGESGKPADAMRATKSSAPIK